MHYNALQHSSITAVMFWEVKHQSLLCDKYKMCLHQCVYWYLVVGEWFHSLLLLPLSVCYAALWPEWPYTVCPEMSDPHPSRSDGAGLYQSAPEDKWQMFWKDQYYLSIHQDFLRITILIISLLFCHFLFKWKSREDRKLQVDTDRFKLASLLCTSQINK